MMNPPASVFALSLDLVMVSLAIMNLAWIVFDSMWVVPELYQLMAWIIPDTWLSRYDVVHAHFFRIDLVFVAIFLTEFCVRWAESLWRRRYGAWFVYPVLHWYDVLGCIPIAGFRWLRVLRIFAVLYRLQRMGIINYTRWLPYRWVMNGYEVVLEEISDRVVVRILGGIQAELKAANGLEQRIVEQVILPRKEPLMLALRTQINQIGQNTYGAAREELHHFITLSVRKAVKENREIKVIDAIPVVGGVVSGLLDHAITDIVCRVIDELADRLNGQEFSALFEQIFQAIFDTLRDSTADSASQGQLIAAVSDVLEVVKQQVAQRRWLEQVNTTARRA